MTVGRLSVNQEWLRSASAAIRDVGEHDPAKRLSSEEKRMALLCRASHNKTSWVTPVLFLCSSLGKLILGFGASLAVKGHYDSNKNSLITGAVLAGIALVGCIAAALGFGAAASRVNGKRGLAFKAVSISGAVLIGVGYSINQIYVSTSHDGEVERIRLSFIPLMFGTGLLCISLPNFVAYTELLRGRVPFIPIPRRRLIALASFSPSLGILFAGWVTGEHGRWPTPFNAVMLTFAIATALVGVSINWSDNLRIRAELFERMLCQEEEEEISRTTNSAEVISEKPSRPRAVSQDMQHDITHSSTDTSPTLAGSHA